jgi:hypothetical protein
MTRLLRYSAFLALTMVAILGACQRDAPLPKECVAYPPDLTLALENGLLRKDFRIANAWAVKSDKPMTANNASIPAWFLSADIVAANGEAVVGTWVTDDITKDGHIYSVSRQATKYTKWGGVGDPATAGLSIDTPGAKESITCVLTHRAKPGQVGVTP